MDLASVAVAMLSHLATERDRLEAFLDATGLSLAAFRDASTDGSLQNGLLDHLASDDSLLVAVAAAMDLAPEAVAAAIAARMQGRDLT